jgi:hypothetical protein
MFQADGLPCTARFWLLAVLTAATGAKLRNDPSRWLEKHKFDLLYFFEL